MHLVEFNRKTHASASSVAQKTAPSGKSCVWRRLAEAMGVGVWRGGAGISSIQR